MYYQENYKYAEQSHGEKSKAEFNALRLGKQLLFPLFVFFLHFFLLLNYEELALLLVLELFELVINFILESPVFVCSNHVVNLSAVVLQHNKNSGYLVDSSRSFKREQSL